MRRALRTMGCFFRTVRFVRTPANFNPNESLLGVGRARFRTERAVFVIVGRKTYALQWIA